MRSLTRSQHMVKKNQRETNRKSASRYHKHAHRHLDSKSHEPHGLLVPIPWYLVNILKMNRNPKRTKYVKMFTIVYLEISGRFGLTHDHTRIRTSEWITWAHQRLCALAVPQCLNSPSQSALDKIWWNHPIQSGWTHLNPYEQWYLNTGPRNLDPQPRRFLHVQQFMKSIQSFSQPDPVSNLRIVGRLRSAER